MRKLGIIEGDRVDRRSACPGLFRMTPARDGRICRVKLSCGRLSTEQARTAADVADRYGNGIIEITNRANLQLRGIAESDTDAVILALTEAGLGPLVPEGDDIRNVMVNPTAGIDEALAFDTLPLAEKLLETLQTTPAYHTLSPKFSILLDGGEACAMVRHTSDIWLAATKDGKAFAFGLASCPPVEICPSPLPSPREERGEGGIDVAASSFSPRAARQGDEGHSTTHNSSFGIVTAENAHVLITALLDLFLEISADHSGIVRIKHLLAEKPASDMLERLKARLPFPIESAADWRRAPPRPFEHLGVRRQRQEGFAYAGAAAPLGRLTPPDIRALADIAAQANGGQIRLTPWQSVLLPNIPADRACGILDSLNALGLASEPGDPLASMIACSGSNGCVSALADTQADGARLAQLLKSSEATPVHLTGCAKSCASIRPAPATLVAVEPGRYDLFLREPAGPSRFGRLLAANITIEEAARLLSGRGSLS
ncbi:precorrin-3B synthase [Phyllobacterium phragmitis]|uniref:Precorrin-3B synthase n=1 Tax=Phyllobacterium phragmitis TaxID=2670329 RepID=A0ABQ0GYW5_9HYPH